MLYLPTIYFIGSNNGLNLKKDSLVKLLLLSVKFKTKVFSFIESFLGFVYDKRDKFGHTMMKFPDKDTVEFVDPLEYNKAILRAIDEAVEEAQSTREV